MKEYTGDRFYVNLGASKARRRIKGHGLGVKKVQSAGRNQAVIIHTATGEHRRQLENLFADVISSTSEAESGVPVENVEDSPGH